MKFADAPEQAVKLSDLILDLIRAEKAVDMLPHNESIFPREATDAIYRKRTRAYNAIDEFVATVLTPIHIVETEIDLASQADVEQFRRDLDETRGLYDEAVKLIRLAHRHMPTDAVENQFGYVHVCLRSFLEKGSK